MKRCVRVATGASQTFNSNIRLLRRGSTLGSHEQIHLRNIFCLLGFICILTLGAVICPETSVCNALRHVPQLTAVITANPTWTILWDVTPCIRCTPNFWEAACMINCSNLKMETTCSPETQVSFHWTSYISEGGGLCRHRCENMRSESFLITARYKIADLSVTPFYRFNCYTFSDRESNIIPDEERILLLIPYKIAS